MPPKRINPVTSQPVTDWWDECYGLAVTYILVEDQNGIQKTPEPDLISLADHLEAAAEAWFRANDYTSPNTVANSPEDIDL